MRDPVTAYLGLGSNLGDRNDNLASAIERLRACEGIEVIRIAAFLETEPVGCMPQNDFLNTVAEVRTSLSADELLRCVKGVENAMGRQPGDTWGARNIDIDILFYGDEVVVTSELVIPHPLVCERIFALKPMVELNGDLRHPVFEQRLADIYRERRAELSLYHCVGL